MRQKTVFLLALGIMAISTLAIGCGTAEKDTSSSETSDFQNIDQKKAEELQSQGVRLIDVREPDEFAEGHIQGAELVPLGQVEETMAQWNKQQPLIVMCRSGNRSAQAAQLLVDNGFKEIYNLEGGIVEWKGELLKGGSEY